MYLIFQDKNVQMMNMKYCYKTKVYLTALRYVCFYNAGSKYYLKGKHTHSQINAPDGLTRGYGV
jgi:hypothetical protein